jgi:protein involved in polysaccharide export with SLBB domain
MQLQSWRYSLVILITCGAGLLCAGLPTILAQSKSSVVESFNRRAGELSSAQGDFAPGDGVRITVWRDLSVADQSGVQNLGLNDDFVIDNKGYVTLPIIGEIRAVGHTRKSLARTIEDSLDIKAIRARCIPLIRVTLMGAVNKPGSYLIEPQESLWGLIDEAGGPSNGADVRKIYIERRGKVVVDNLLESFEQAHSLEQIGVRSGDQIYVPGVSRFTWRSVVDYVSLGASLLLIYFQIANRAN